MRSIPPCGGERLSLARDGDAATVEVPVVADSPRTCQGTPDVPSHVGDEDLPVRVGRYDPLTGTVLSGR